MIKTIFKLILKNHVYYCLTCQL
ncbi:hypothetical protein IRZ83_19155 [Flavobacterium sp. JLP]|nr:hypothetical protein [Flavobacterium sp. JLP]